MGSVLRKWESMRWGVAFAETMGEGVWFLCEAVVYGDEDHDDDEDD